MLVLTTSGITYSQVNLEVDELTPDENNPLGYNADTLKRWVQDILRGRGGMVDTNSIKFTGDYRALGRFMNGSDVGFDKGLIISNGKVESAEPTIPTGSMSDYFDEFNPDPLNPNPTGDPDLLGMYKTLGIDTAQYYTGDAAVLEFTYRPFGDQIILEYIFASEEYPSSRFQTGPADQDMTDFPNTPQVFDIFGISINTNSQFHNLAFTPPTQPNNQPPEPQRWVTVQHINENSNSSYFQPNPTSPPPLGQELGTQYDGMTKAVGNLGPLNIKLNSVTPCGNYKVKIAIEDFLWISPDPNQEPDGFKINSALFLNKNSLRSSVQMTNTQYSDWSVKHEFTQPSLDGELVENCNDIEARFILEDSINQDYSIPFKIIPKAYRDSVLVSYEDGTVITNDSIKIERGLTEKKIIISSTSIGADHQNIQFQYPENPCDFPPPPPLSGGYHGKIYFNMRNNEPIGFTQNPKVYEAYCKETIELTVTDITYAGVTPLFYRWGLDVMAHDTINYKVEASPDYVQVTVNDYCSNESIVQVQINNKPVELDNILDAFLCGPGQFADVPVNALLPDYDDYTIDHVKWYKGTQLLGEADGDIIHVVYDDAVGDGIWTCSFEITDCCGGTQTGSFLVNQSELSLGDDQWICKGQDKELIANVTAQSFRWYAVNNPTVTLSLFNSVTVTPDVTTEYALEILDDCGETQTAYIIVNVDLFEPTITINPASAEICPGENIILTANDAVEWSWSPGGETTQSITLAPTTPDAYLYTLTSSSEYCFDKVTSATFEVFPIPVAEFSVDPLDEGCTGESIVFEYLGNTTSETIFEWNFGDGSQINNQENPTHIYTLPGTYSVYLHVDEYICDNDTTIWLKINPLPAPDFSADIFEGCSPIDVVFQDNSTDVIQPGATYEWDFGDGQTSTDIGSTSHQYIQAGLFDVSLKIQNTDRCGETIIKSSYVQVNPNPIADFEADPPITTMDTPIIDFIDLTITDSAIITYDWDFGDGEYDTVQNPSHTYSLANNYEVILIVKTVNGCRDTIRGNVALTEEAVLFIPNAFTPNNDGLNDEFEIKGTSIADYNLYIYDRWGKVVWSTHNFEVYWDGTNKSGDPVSPGSYIYQIVGTDYLNQGINYQGTVTVIR